MPRREPLFPLLFLLAAACGPDVVSLRGTLGEGTDVAEVWVGGATERARVEADSFRLEGIRGDTVELRFTDSEGEPAHMRLTGLPDGGELRMDGIWVADGLAFPAQVSMPEAGVLTVNGLRMAGSELLPAEVDAAGTLLAIGDDALLVRPTDARLPDLRVVVTPGTVARSPDGEPAELGRLEFGDSLRVIGAAEQGFVVAAEVVVPRERSGGKDRSADDTEASSDLLAAGAASAAASRAAAPRVSGAAESDKAEKKGRGKAKGRGKGRHR